jgi:hypothetical protein
VNDSLGAVVENITLQLKIECQNERLQLKSGAVPAKTVDCKLEAHGVGAALRNFANGNVNVQVSPKQPGNKVWSVNSLP